MTTNTGKRIRLLYGIVLSVALVIAGLCLMVACVDIYNSGPKPFSPAAVSAAFSTVAVPVYVALALALGSFLLALFLPAEKSRYKADTSATTLRKLSAKIDPESADKALLETISLEQKRRKTHRNICTVLLVVGSVIFLNYATTPDNFHQSQINDSMVQAMYRMIPCLAIPFGYYVFTAYFSGKSIARELAAVKQIIASGCTRSPAPAEITEKTNWVTVARFGVLALALCLTIYGYFAGGTLDVLTKAINICTECVGLG